MPLFLLQAARSKAGEEVSAAVALLPGAPIAAVEEDASWIPPRRMSCWALFKLVASLALVIFVAGMVCGYKLARWQARWQKPRVSCRSTQSQTTYTFKANSPRFTPMPTS